MLEHHADPKGPGTGRVVDGHFVATPKKRSLIGTQDAVDDFYERALARAVLPEERMNLPRSNFKINVVVRNTAGKCLADSLEL